LELATVIPTTMFPGRALRPTKHMRIFYHHADHEVVTTTTETITITG
jgi:hypothetical protein